MAAEGGAAHARRGEARTSTRRCLGVRARMSMFEAALSGGTFRSGFGARWLRHDREQPDARHRCQNVRMSDSKSVGLKIWHANQAPDLMIKMYSPAFFGFLKIGNAHSAAFENAPKTAQNHPDGAVHASSSALDAYRCHTRATPCSPADGYADTGEVCLPGCASNGTDRLSTTQRQPVGCSQYSSGVFRFHSTHLQLPPGSCDFASHLCTGIIHEWYNKLLVYPLFKTNKY